MIEFPYLPVMVENRVFDMIYHEHLSYIAVNPLKFVLRQFGLEIFAIEKVAMHGGSLRVFSHKKNAGHPLGPEVNSLLREERDKGYGSLALYQEFAGKVYQVKRDLNAFVDQIRSEGKTLSGYGAPAKGNTLINFCGLSSKEIRFLVDDNPLKQNLFSPGAKIPVVPAAHLFEHPSDYVLIFAWNLAEEIIRKLEPLRKGGVKFMVPLPQPKIV